MTDAKSLQNDQYMNRDGVRRYTLYAAHSDYVQDLVCDWVALLGPQIQLASAKHSKATWAGVGIASPGTQGPDYLPHLGTESSQHLLHAIGYNKDSPLRLSLMITSQLMFSSNLCITANGGALEELEFHIHLLPSRVLEVVPSVIHGRRIPVLNIVRLDRPALRATTLIRWYLDDAIITVGTQEKVMHFISNTAGGRSGKGSFSIIALLDLTVGCGGTTYQPCSDEALADLRLTLTLSAQSTLAMPLILLSPRARILEMSFALIYDAVIVRERTAQTETLSRI
ncbi:hypothetical protein AGABI1DRAFT_128462 [Agaricus bisporus var. burnettii JB137-S8]|uniref:Uncharacterized protein n=1 Tax=Agaricus bisporus var. burnettii (strain JB137-S8 / ATCC MYA-4627 / FGSC 10392) TaxID=597362 RepID=K5X8I0_AGABU|nr:uncharacterized protein AGABI1DRAFT_128462 [Agaricus bisporus var. burnettii JB137-S8]EKM79307.1 hypothetical protein AGABI1DRAFT_128462 [Agaricus bisporus var. burnettii JB137-S8]